MQVEDELEAMREAAEVCTVTGPSLHNHCTVTAPSLICLVLNRHGTVTAPSLHHHCTITVGVGVEEYGDGGGADALATDAGAAMVQ